MFDLRPMPDQIDPALIAKLEKVETATVGHVLHSQFADIGLRAVLPEKRVAGTAVTLRIPGADSTLLHHLMSLVRPGDFLVIDRCGDSHHACWGGVITNAAKLGGVVGAVIDGPATDFNEVRRVACRSGAGDRLRSRPSFSVLKVCSTGPSRSAASRSSQAMRFSPTKAAFCS